MGLGTKKYISSQNTNGDFNCYEEIYKGFSPYHDIVIYIIDSCGPEGRGP